MYMMQVQGHGGCLVDAGFAHLKRKYRYYVWVNFDIGINIFLLDISVLLDVDE